MFSLFIIIFSMCSLSLKCLHEEFWFGLYLIDICDTGSTCRFLGNLSCISRFGYWGNFLNSSKRFFHYFNSTLKWRCFLSWVQFLYWIRHIAILSEFWSFRFDVYYTLLLDLIKIISLIEMINFSFFKNYSFYWILCVSLLQKQSSFSNTMNYQSKRS